ncbi:T9SS type A sorting domain-containing protein [Schleiferiaceae bacterium]|nr:T9SS type A sorting domain-containing protein [Schleiferiaceae bacterium]
MKHWIGIFFAWVFASSLWAQPLSFSIPKTKTFVLTEGEADFDLQVQNLEAPDAFSKQAALREIKAAADARFGVADYSALPAQRSLKTTAEDPLLLDEFGMKLVYPINGVSYALAGGTPNDNTVAFSKDSILLAAVNTRIWAWDLKTDTFHFPQQFLSLTQASGIQTSAYASDPRLLYDHAEDRWVLLFFVGNTPSTSEIVVCFSQTSDPADGWNMYTLPGNPLNNNRWSDFPSMAFTDDKLVMSINLIIPGVSWQVGFDGTVIWEMDKVAGYSGAAALPSELHHGIQYNGKWIRNLVAVNGWNGYVSTPMWASNRNFSAQNDTMFFLRRNDSAVGGAHSYDIFNVPTTIPYGVPPDARQPSSDPNNSNYHLSTNDGRWLGALELSDGSVHVVSTTRDFATNRCAIYHGELPNPWVPDSLYGHIIAHPTRDLGYPNVVAIGNEPCDQELLIGFNHSSTTEKAGVSAVYRGNDGSYSDFITIKEGEGVVNKLSGLERWGDYFGLQTVYHDPQKVWAAGFYALLNGGNSTWFGLLQSPDSTALHAEFTAEGIGCDQSLSATVMGGEPPYTFIWNDQTGGPSVDGICSGDTVELYITDARGCVRYDRIYMPYLDVDAPVIFPNPTPGEALMAFDAPTAGSVEVRVLDATGRMLYQAERQVKEGRNEVQLWMGHLPQGQYVVHVLFGSHRADQSEPMELVAQKLIVLPGN